MNLSFQTDTISDMLVKASPPVTVTGLTLFGVPLLDIVQLATLIYVTLLGLDKIYIMFLRYREERRKTLHEIKGEDEPKE